MREEIAAAIIRRNKAEAFGIVEPLDRAGLSTHCLFPFDDDGLGARRALEIKESYRGESNRNGPEKGKTEERPTLTT
jgi:hypothetical protein